MRLPNRNADSRCSGEQGETVQCHSSRIRNLALFTRPARYHGLGSAHRANRRSSDENQPLGRVPEIDLDFRDNWQNLID
ncbi:hypothetical protein OK015_11945 [Mycobacterium sp. Aquia_216]|uniref:hypothetical protein n=1 Tax=Mycobacterium sp. Aquia_216 TaxID=2991729 RepID=UPI00227A41C5|nr:hypothetical protein [Mycobacterium sp. Aquia_216]WAJ47093.1 hypothetical protein OK015_11945 [Mycobacterium sp. Aquia_216]